MIKPILASALCLATSVAFAEESRQECLGRLTFQVPEEIEWATYDAERTFRISTGGGHNFTSKVTAKGDLAAYDYHDLVIYISDIVDRSEFEGAVSYQKGTGRLYQQQLEKDLESHKRLLKQFETGDYPESLVADRLEKIAAVEKNIPLAVPIEHDLGIPDAYFIGGQTAPVDAYLYREGRVYFFAMNKANKHSADHFRDLVSRFSTRDLYEVPEGPGICFPYGFIADDGKTAYSIKNSLRFTSTPNVIFTLVTTSAEHPWNTVPTTGTYDTDYSPGYDGKKWELTRFIEPSYIGGHLAGLEGWRLEPKLDSGEQERAWFALAHTGGGTRPMVAVQIFTFQKGVDDLTEFTPPPEEVLPRWKALSKTIQVTLDK
ncbi:T6SS immunity protein Tli4 family protein [Halopseudomonas pelagia]|uniref:T6SS immunity protein Tli4 family protein n=2 Tax=Halopseudomonas pelagia TaxID=553151 RepID=UPI0030DBF491